MIRNQVSTNLFILSTEGDSLDINNYEKAVYLWCTLWLMVNVSVQTLENVSEETIYKLVSVSFLSLANFHNIFYELYLQWYYYKNGFKYKYIYTCTVYFSFGVV